jgi:hypothetical protein
MIKLTSLRLGSLAGVVAAVVVLIAFQNCGDSFSAGNLKSKTQSSLSKKASECEFNGAFVRDGESVIAFYESSVPAGQVCQSEIRQCRNGHLSGSYGFASCGAQLPTDTSSNPTPAPSAAPAPPAPAPAPPAPANPDSANPAPAAPAPAAAKTCKMYPITTANDWFSKGPSEHDVFTAEVGTIEQCIQFCLSKNAAHCQKFNSLSVTTKQSCLALGVGTQRFPVPYAPNNADYVVYGGACN